MIRIGNAPCSWGTLEFAGSEGKQIAYGQMLDELAATGYTGTELGDWGYMPTDPETLYAELARRNLSLTGAFVPVALKEAAAHTPGEANALKVARLLTEVADRLGAAQRPFLVLADDNGKDPIRTQHAGRATPEMALNDEEWQTFTTGAERIAQMVHNETGLPTVFHPHCAGFVETPAEIERFLAMTDPQLVGLVFDTGHYVYGSGSNETSIRDALDRFAGRIQYVHFKDCDPAVASRARTEDWAYFTAVGEGVFCELGQGCVAFPDALEWLHENNYEGFVTVEQDVLPGMGTPRESAARNRRYLQSIGL